MSEANEVCLQRLVRRALAPVVGDCFKMPDGCGRIVIYVTEDGLVGYRETWDTGHSPAYFVTLEEWSSIVHVWLGNGVKFVEANNNTKKEIRYGTV